MLVMYESYRKCLVSFINQQVLGIRYFPRSCAPYNCHHIHSLLHKSTSIRYQVFSKAICFVSLAYMSHPEIILIHKYKVLGIFKGHMFHIIIIYESSQNGLDLNPQVSGIRYFQRSHALYHRHICVVSKWSCLLH